MRIVFLLILFTIIMLMAATARADQEVPAQVLCRNGKVVAIRLFLPRPGVVVVQIPEGACDKPAPADEKKPAPKSPTMRDAAYSAQAT